jgi:uncharacterized protein
LTPAARRGIDRRVMSLSPAASRQLLRTAESLLIGTLGGYLFDAAKFPAGWLAGAMVFSAVAALAGRPIMVPAWISRTSSIALGISLGSVVTPETLRGMATWPLSVFMVCVAMGAVTLATMTYLTRVHGWNRLTAIFASTPGGLAQVMALATEEGRDCDTRGVAIVQTLRVIILAVVVPAVLSLAGLTGVARPPASADAIAQAPVAFSAMVVASVAVAFGLLRLGFPGGLIFGPMLVSAALHGGAFITGALPLWLVVSAMVCLGTVSGGRFTGTPFRLLVGYLGAALGAFVVSLVVAIGVGASVRAAVSVPLPDMVVAYAPGAVDAMMILALALHLDPVFVGAHHLTRVFTVSVGLPILVHYVTRRAAKRRKNAFPPQADRPDEPL